MQIIKKANQAYVDQKEQIRLKQQTSAIKRISSSLKISEEDIILGENLRARSDSYGYYDFSPEQGLSLAYFPGFYGRDGQPSAFSEESFRLSVVDGENVEFATEEIKRLSDLGREIARVRDFRKKNIVINEKLDESVDEPKINEHPAMPWLIRKILEKICAKLVKQGYNHKSLITEYYRIMASAAQKEFSEDNAPTLQGFLEDCHKEAMQDF